MIILGTNSIKDTGYNVANSLRFNDGSQDSLQRSPSSASNRRTWTFSAWVKRGNLGADQIIFSGGSANTWIRLLGTDALEFNIQDNDESTIVTTQLFRDISAWSHIVVAIDTTQGTASNRIKFYVNGNQVTSFSTSVYVSQNYDAGINNTGAHYIGRLNYAATQWFDGYMSEVCFIDGQQLAPDQFGEFDEDSGIWKPIDVSGLTFGTNGFYLETKQSGTSQNSSGLGADTSGNDNHFAVNNLTAIDQSTDTCTNNFATLNPLGMPSTNTTFSEGNLTVDVASGSSFWSVPTIGVSSGKWYVEGKLVTGTAASGVTYSDYGFADRSDSAGEALYASSGRVFWLSSWDSKINYRTGGSTTAGLQTSKTGLSQGDFFQLYLDMDNELMYWGRNGSVTNSTGISFNGKESLTGEYFFAFGDQFTSGTYKYSTNFGQGSIDGSAAANYNDANGFGNFKYNPSVTTDEGDKDFLALCTKNLAEYG